MENGPLIIYPYGVSEIGIPGYPILWVDSSGRSHNNRWFGGSPISENTHMRYCGHLRRWFRNANQQFLAIGDLILNIHKSWDSHGILPPSTGARFRQHWNGYKYLGIYLDKIAPDRIIHRTEWESNTHMLHVWNIYQHLPPKSPKCR